MRSPGSSTVHTTLGGHHGWNAAGTASLIPFVQFGRLGGRSQQPSFEDTLGHGCPGRCSRGEIIYCCVEFAGNMVQFQGIEFLLELPHVDEVCRELGIVAAAIPLDLLDD